MKTGMLITLAGVFGLAAAMAQAPPAAQRTGPGVQAPQDAKEADLLKTCKVPPPGRGGARGGFAGRGRGGARGPAPTYPRQVTVAAIPGVVAAGAMWKDIWMVEGNNADGIISSGDGGILLAQNDNSAVVKLMPDGKTSVVYSGLNTSGSVDRSDKGALFVLNRGLHETVEELAPKKKVLADNINGDPLDCIGGVLNDITADSHGGVYFTMGTVFHADAKGKVTRYGENLNTNGIMLSPDEKHLWVTNGATLAEFDVQKDGSLTNQHEFAKLPGAGDGSTFDSQGRMYVTTSGDGGGVAVISPDGKELGVIPTPRPVISVTFSGPDRKTLFAVSRVGNTDWIIAIPMEAQGPKGRGK